MKRPSIIDAVIVPAPANEAQPNPEPKPAPKPKSPSAIVHTSVYLPRSAHRRLKEIALVEDCKVHDLIMRGVDEVLRRYGHEPTAPKR